MADDGPAIQFPYVLAANPLGTATRGNDAERIQVAPVVRHSNKSMVVYWYLGMVPPPPSTVSNVSSCSAKECIDGHVICGLIRGFFSRKKFERQPAPLSRVFIQVAQQANDLLKRLPEASRHGIFLLPATLKFSST